MGWVVAENALFYRQMSQLLSEGPGLAIHGENAFEGLILSNRYRTILTSRVYGGLGVQLRRLIISLARERPCVIAFLGGLAFYPDNG